MIHDKCNYQIDDIAYNDIVLTRVYQVLFNRIIKSCWDLMVTILIIAKTAALCAH